MNKLQFIDKYIEPLTELLTKRQQTCTNCIRVRCSLWNWTNTLSCEQQAIQILKNISNQRGSVIQMYYSYTNQFFYNNKFNCLHYDKEK